MSVQSLWVVGAGFKYGYPRMQNRAPENQVPRNFQESFLTHAKTTSHLHYTLKPRPFPKILMSNTMSDRALIFLSFLDFLARAKTVAGPTDMIFLIRSPVSMGNRISRHYEADLRAYIEARL